MCIQGQIARSRIEVAAADQPSSARRASENINVSDLTPLSASGPFILVIVRFLVWGEKCGLFLNGCPLSDG